MSAYVLSCCSTVDLTREKIEARGIKWVPFHYEIDGKEYLDDFGETISYSDFYAAMAKGSSTKTSQVNVGEFYKHFKAMVSEGKDVLHISFSSGLSGAYGSAEIAAKTIREEFPERNVIVVDSLCASSGYGLFMDKLADLKDSGMEMDELAAFALENRLNVHHWFFSTDLHYYVLGGRISKAAGAIGGALKICPVLNMSNEGKLTPREKVRTKKKAIARVVDIMKEHAADGKEYRGKVFICNSACLEDAQAVANMVEEAFPQMDGPVEIFPIGTTIGSHTGPGTVSLFFWGDERVN